MSDSAWRKSSRCEQTNCVEVAWRDRGMVAVRNSTEPGTHLTFDGASWRGLIQGVRSGQLER